MCYGDVVYDVDSVMKHYRDCNLKTQICVVNLMKHYCDCNPKTQKYVLLSIADQVCVRMK